MNSNLIKFTDSFEDNEFLNELITIFFEFCTEEELAYIIAKIVSYYSNLENKPKCNYKDENGYKRFFNYFRSKKELLNFNYIKYGVNIAASCKNGYDFINNFIRFVVGTNLEDMTIRTGLSDKEDKLAYSVALCSLGDYTLAHMELITTNAGILFDNVKVKDNLRNLGIGTALFNKVLNDIEKYYPEQKLYTDYVSKNNKSAIAFYKSISGNITNGILEAFYSVTFDTSNPILKRKIKYTD